MRTGNGHRLPYMWDTTARRMAWKKRHKKATSVPRLSPVPSGTEEQGKATPCNGKYLPARMLQRYWGPKFPAVELGITRRCEGAEVAHVKSLQLALGAGKRAGIQGNGMEQGAEPASTGGFCDSK